MEPDLSGWTTEALNEALLYARSEAEALRATRNALLDEYTDFCNVSMIGIQSGMEDDLKATTDVFRQKTADLNAAERNLTQAQCAFRSIAAELYSRD